MFTVLSCRTVNFFGPPKKNPHSSLEKLRYRYWQKKYGGNLSLFNSFFYSFFDLFSFLKEQNMSFQQAMSQSPSPPLDGITEANMPQPQLSKGKVQAVIMETERVFFFL